MLTRSSVSLAALFALAACGPASRAAASGPTSFGKIDDTRLLAAAKEPQNWLVHGGSYREQYYSALDQINVDNVGQLKLAWSLEVDTYRGQESEPLVVDGVMYITTAWSHVYAIDAKTGRQIWYYNPKVPGETGPKGCCDALSRGAAVADGKVYVGTFDGRLIALDARTGALLWSVVTVDRSKSYTITGAPRVVKGKVIIGNGGAEYPVRGYVSAYDGATGKLVWRFYTVPADPAKGSDGAASDEPLARLAASTWYGKWYERGGGGTVWDAIVYDPELDQLYVGTGNGSPGSYYLRSEGKGDNLFISSILALNPDTGKYLWHYQENPGEAWDFDATQPMMLADLAVGGQPHKVLMHAPKNGFFYVIDRRNGKVLSADPFVKGIRWATGIDLKTGRPEEAPGSRYIDNGFMNSPTFGGAHSWQPMAYSPKTGLVYIPTSINATFYPSAKSGQLAAPLTRPDVQKTENYLQAWDPIRHREVWRSDASGGRLDSGGGGVLATSGGLVFQGRGEIVGEFLALRADTGETLWRYRTPSIVMAPPVSYSIDGEQYVAVIMGRGGPVIFGAATQPMARQLGRIVAFKLNGSAPPLPQALPAPAPNPPAGVLSAAAVTEGAGLYARYCSTCHGYNIENASNIIPDLRRSPLLTDKDAWHKVVIDGALNANGMISWAKELTPEQAESIRTYVGAQAQKLQRKLAATAAAAARP